MNQSCWVKEPDRESFLCHDVQMFCDINSPSRVAFIRADNSRLEFAAFVVAMYGDAAGSPEV